MPFEFETQEVQGDESTRNSDVEEKISEVKPKVLNVAVSSQKGELGSKDSFGYLLLAEIAKELEYELNHIATAGIKIAEDHNLLKEEKVDIIFDHVAEGDGIYFSENYGERFETTFGFRETDKKLINEITGKLREYRENGKYEQLFTDYYGERFARIGVMDITDNLSGENSVGFAILSEILSQNNFQYEVADPPLSLDAYYMLLRIDAVDILVSIDQFYNMSTDFSFLLSEPYAKELYVTEYQAHYSFAVNEGNEELMNILNKGIESMKKSGRLDQLLEEYGWKE